MTSAIFYVSDGFNVGKDRVMGRQVAGNSFLKAYFKYTKYSEFWVYSKTTSEVNEFVSFARSEGRKEKINFINYENTGALNKPGLLFYPGPDINLQVKNRSFFRNDAWSICGITHTTCSTRVIESVKSLVTSPINAWDALICTSEAAKSNIIKIIDMEEENLKVKLNATNFIRPELPVIPLGIDYSLFQFSKEERNVAKQELGIKSDEIVILYVGRLSAHAKANPFSMYKVLEKVSEKSDKKIVLIECGWFGNEGIKDSFIQASNYLCPNIRIIKLDGRNSTLKYKSFAASDIFCSLSDNIQETFGITPIEAMAASLPVVVSDWDGYKETVRDGIDGYRIPTLMPEPGDGMDLSVRYVLDIDNYDTYIGNVSNYISMDFEYLTNTFMQLINNPELRIKMGQNARIRALENYDWSVIIPQYESLWNSLNIARLNSGNYKWNNTLDPFFAFSSYPTNILSDELMIRLVEANINITLRRMEEIKKLKIVNFSGYTLPDDQIVTAIISKLDKTKSIHSLKDELHGLNAKYLNRTLCWLNKFNIIHIESSNQS